MHFLQFLNHNETSHKFFQINDFIKTKLPGPNIDKERTLAKIVKKHMVHRLHGNNDANAP